MKKLLALNRSEIAIRIMRAATELGLRTVAIYSKEDRLSLHRFKADEAYQIGEGKGPVRGLSGRRRASCAGQGKGRRRHPSRLRISVGESGAAARLRAGGHHVRRPERGAARAAGRQDRGAATGARRPGVPIIPGTESRVDEPRARPRRLAQQDRLPADHQGGVRRRRARHARGRDARRTCSASSTKRSREAAAAFGNDAVFLERYIRARAAHRSADPGRSRTATSLHLYERDCSVQRRHQKVVEVAPAVALGSAVRTAIWPTPPCAWRARPATTTPARWSFWWMPTPASGSSSK